MGPGIVPRFSWSRSQIRPLQSPKSGFWGRVLGDKHLVFNPNGPILAKIRKSNAERARTARPRMIFSCWVSRAYASSSAALSLAVPASSRPMPMPAASPATALSLPHQQQQHRRAELSAEFTEIRTGRRI
eukprot:3248410-Pyramimonas_sp.AAC.1